MNTTSAPGTVKDTKEAIPDPKARRKAGKQEVEAMLRMGVIEESHKEQCSPRR